VRFVLQIEGMDAMWPRKDLGSNDVERHFRHPDRLGKHPTRTLNVTGLLHQFQHGHDKWLSVEPEIAASKEIQFSAMTLPTSCLSFPIT